MKRERRHYPTYDEIRMAAPLVTCSRCRRSFYMAPPRPIFIECRRELERGVAGSRSDGAPVLAKEGMGDAILANGRPTGDPVLAGHAPAVPERGEGGIVDEEIDTFAQWSLVDLDVDNPQAG